MKSYERSIFVVGAALLAACGDNGKQPTDAPPSPVLDGPGPVVDAPPAPAGGCASNADCRDGEICLWAPQHACGHDQARGTCVTEQAQLCPDLAFWVCGCDGHAYFNQCLSEVAASDIDYGGPCRPAGTFVPCTTSADCPTDLTFHQFCVDDPRDACDPSQGDTGCAGVCVHGNQTCSFGSPCPPTGSTSDIDSPDTEACVALAGADASSDPGVCAYTTRLRCVSTSDCGAGELCLPDFECDAGAICLGWCSRP